MTTSLVCGEAEWDACTRAAGYMAMHVYTDPLVPPSDPAHQPPAALQSFVDSKNAEVDRNWEEWDDHDRQSSHGLVARLFKLKSWDPDDSEAPVCPPCLAYRGTDFEDMRDLGVSVRVGTLAPTIPGVTWGGLPDIFDRTFVFDKSLAAELGDAPTHRQVLSAGFTSRDVFNETGVTRVEMANFGIRLGWVFRIRLAIMAREDGDWANNVLQGLGESSRQYEAAIRYGEEVVRYKIMALADKRLKITGHSLGGGLAAAVATVLTSRFPNVQVHGVTFNAAGVHENTVRPAALNSAPIVNFAVKDEILTTVQSFTGVMPIAGPVFQLAARRLGQTGMPAALGNLMPLPGRAPPGSPHASAGGSLPQLFPMLGRRAADRHRYRFPILEAIDGMLANASSVQNFGNRFMEWLNENYRDRALQSAESTLGLIPIWRLYQEMFRLLHNDAQPEIEALTATMLMAVDYHGMSYVVATTDVHYPGAG